MKNSKLIVTLALGKKYLDTWKRLAEANWRKYAQIHGYDLLCIDHPLDESDRAKKRSPSWQKCLILSQPFSQDYERIVWIDSDIVINTAHAPSIVEGVPIDRVGAVPAFTVPSSETCLEALKRLSAYWTARGGNVIPDTPKKYHVNYGLPEFDHDQVVQCGVMVLSPKRHRDLLEKAYYEYEEKGGPEWHYEARPLSYELLKANVVYWIDHRFNQLWLFDKVLHYPFLFDLSSDGDIHTRIKRKLAGLIGFRQRDLEVLCANVSFVNNYFLHFGASLDQMELVDTTIDSWNQCRLPWDRTTNGNFSGSRR
jgi:hypothetical protein